MLMPLTPGAAYRSLGADEGEWQAVPVTAKR